MKLVNLATIESTISRRVALVLHAPVVAWTVVLFFVESVVNTVRNFVVNMVHVVANTTVGVLSAVSGVAQDFADMVSNGFRQLANDIAYVWRGRPTYPLAPAPQLAQAPEAVGGGVSTDIK